MKRCLQILILLMFGTVLVIYVQLYVMKERYFPWV